MAGIPDTEVWIIGTPAEIDAIRAALAHVGYITYGPPAQSGLGPGDRRLRAYLRVLCRMQPTAAAQAA